jgi:small subunit ribosomal protein S6
MPALKREYECVYVTPAELPDETTAAVNNRIKDTIENNGGQVVRWHTWGKRKLAYPIEKHTKGTYYHVTFLADATFIKEFDRNLKLIEAVLRFLTVQVDEDIDPIAKPTENIEPVLVKKEEPGRARRERGDRGDRRDYDGDDGETFEGESSFEGDDAPDLGGDDR